MMPEHKTISFTANRVNREKLAEMISVTSRNLRPIYYEGTPYAESLVAFFAVLGHMACVTCASADVRGVDR